MISVLIVDDHRPVHMALQAVIRCEADLVVAGVIGNPQVAAEKVRSGPVDVVVLDLELESGSGLERLPAIQSGRDPPEVVVYSIYDGMAVAGSAPQAGARGYVCATSAKTSRWRPSWKRSGWWPTVKPTSAASAESS